MGIWQMKATRHNIFLWLYTDTFSISSDRDVQTRGQKHAYNFSKLPICRTSYDDICIRNNNSSWLIWQKLQMPLMLCLLFIYSTLIKVSLECVTKVMRQKCLISCERPTDILRMRSLKHWKFGQEVVGKLDCEHMM